MQKRDAEELLTNWGRWVWHQAGVPRYTSPMLALMRDNVAQDSIPAPVITDDEALMIDSIIARMWRRDEQMADCLRIYYCTGRTMHGVGVVLKLSRLKVRELLIAGRAYVEACLDLQRAA
ncbi:MAG: antiterminator Q family protein [Pseudomonas sp.]|uniref:antiterminator Q family protein n=1 Tax=Pseudomonas sp. TaxID=306 RepID=UPI003242E857